MTVQDILSAIKTQLQADAALSSVTNYHLVDGMVPGAKPTISIGCGTVKYEHYDRDQDEAHLPVRIYVYARDAMPERGETTIRSLASEIRYALLEDMYLGGVVDSSTVAGITFESDQVEQGFLLHYALIEYDVVYYEPRQRPAGDIPTANEIDATFNSETLNM